ncbi:MAG: DUF5107 domain-containing protein [Opitutaceae bacterium]
MPTTVRHRRESIMLLPFVRDERASLPLPLRRPLAPGASLAGVPAALRARIGKNLVSTAFPYAQWLQTEGRYASADLDLLELENPRWRVVVCANLGGRVLRVYDRRAQRDLLLQPPLLYQGVVGLAGAWFIGGVEFNAFRWGHNIHGSSAIETSRLRLRDGTQAVEFGACDERFGCAWRVQIALGQAQVFFRVELANHGAEPQPDYWWTNLAVPAHRHTRILGAPGPMLHHGMFRIGYQHDAWPRLHGRDWSRWPEHHEIVSAYLYENRSPFFGYLDERDGFALVHQADPAICRGRKLWSVGAGGRDIFSDRLLETAATSYLELQSGLSPMQVEAGVLKPGERRAWTESLGAVTLPDAAGDESYPALFARYEQAAAEAMGAEYRARSSAESWTVADRELVTESAPRVALSARIVLEPERVTAAEVSETVANGWVAGASWRRKLAELEAGDQLTEAGHLALAAAELDADRTDEAARRLRRLASGDTPIGGWAAYLLGLQSGELAVLERAARLLPQRAETWLALDRALAQQRRHAERERLWQRAPAPLLSRDDVRAAQAALAHALGQWPRARELLTAPFVTIPEGAPTVWLLYREAFAAEAFALAGAGDDSGAASMLVRAGQPAPQFGMGRDEAGWGADLLYYRWRIAAKAGRLLEAALLVEQAMQLDAYVGGVAAAYLARLAREAGHPSAQSRLEALRAWSRDGGVEGDGFTPLRAILVEALASGRSDGWRAMLDDPLYGYRAAFELAAAGSPSLPHSSAPAGAPYAGC